MRYFTVQAFRCTRNTNTPIKDCKSVIDIDETKRILRNVATGLENQRALTNCVTYPVYWIGVSEGFGVISSNPRDKENCKYWEVIKGSMVHIAKEHTSLLDETTERRVRGVMSAGGRHHTEPASLCTSAEGFSGAFIAMANIIEKIELLEEEMQKRIVLPTEQPCELPLVFSAYKLEVTHGRLSSNIHELHVRIEMRT